MRSAVVLPLCFVFITNAFAETPETVVVSATRTLQPRDVTGTSLSVITTDDLKIEQTLVLSDALKETPDLNITRNGGVGEDTQISICGSAPGQVLVLIDGIRINDPTAPDGSAVLSDVLVNDIARVEVLRGPQSTLYGSQAIGGVVNVITQRGGEGLSVRASAEGGSLGTYRFNVAGIGSSGSIEYGVATNYYSTGGVSAADARNGNTEPDGYWSFGSAANARVHFDPALSLDLRGYYTSSRNDFDGYPPPTYTLRDDGEFGKKELLAGYVGLNWSIFDEKLLNRFSLSQSAGNRRDFGNFDPRTFAFLPSENFYARGVTTELEYQGALALAADSQLVFGVENERSSIDTASPSPSRPQPAPLRAHVGITSVYAELQSNVWDGFTLTGGVRDDGHETFGNHVSMKVAGAWQLLDGRTVLRANYGDGFKAPTLYQLFSQYSNPAHALAPETAKGWETGLDEFLWDRRIRLAVTYFERRTANQVQFISCSHIVSAACAAKPSGYYDNISRSRATGTELEASAKLADSLDIAANYTHLDAVDLSVHAPLPRMPRNTAFLRATWTPDERWSLSASASFTDSRFDKARRSGPLGAYALANLYASFALTDQFELFGRMENLFDTHYEETLGFGEPGRTGFGGVRAKL